MLKSGHKLVNHRFVFLILTQGYLSLIFRKKGGSGGGKRNNINVRETSALTENQIRNLFGALDDAPTETHQPEQCNSDP